MKVSVITACRNSEQCIRFAMKSVLQQTYPEVEYLLVDGGSIDGTVDIIKSFEPAFEGRLRWISEPDEGLYDALNKGLRMATVKSSAFYMPTNFFAAPDILARVADAFGDGTVDAVFGDVRFVRDQDLSGQYVTTPQGVLPLGCCALASCRRTRLSTLAGRV